MDHHRHLAVEEGVAGPMRKPAAASAASVSMVPVWSSSTTSTASVSTSFTSTQ